MKGKGEKKAHVHLSGKSLCLFSRDSSIRKWAERVITHRHTDNVILSLIVLSSLLLTLEGPFLDPHGVLAHCLKGIDFCVTMVFFAEMILKIIVFGLMCNGKNSYLKSMWNILDCTIVVMSLLLILLEDLKLKQVKIMRMLRVLRPLRMISRNPGMRLVIMSMINAIPDIGNMMLVSILTQCLFSVLGTNLYKGTFFYCYSPNVPSAFIGAIRDKYDCMDHGGEWLDKDQNFNDFLTSQVTFFNIMTTEGWIDVMWDGVDSNKIDEVPIKGNSPNQMWLFLVCMIISSLFILNMFVGITINVFNCQKAALERNHLLTDTQYDWCEALILCYKSIPALAAKETTSCYRRMCYYISDSVFFQAFILVCILMNTTVLAATWYGEPDDLAPKEEKVNLGFNLTFTLEAIIKLSAYQEDYFKEGWNCFDFSIVTLTWLEKVIRYFANTGQGTFTTALRTLRIGRVFRFLKKNKNMKIIFQTFIESFPQLSNVGSLLFLFLFIYSILGVFMFGGVKLQLGLNAHANFQTFGSAFLTLFRMSTGESWNLIMYDAARRESITYDCSGG